MYVIRGGSSVHTVGPIQGFRVPNEVLYHVHSAFRFGSEPGKLEILRYIGLGFAHSRGEA